MDAMKISVVVPLFNGEKFIIETLKSIEKQIYPVYEIVIVNDCSTDQSQKLIELFSSRTTINIKIIENERNYGVSHSRNLGVHESSGDLVLFVDADDLISEQLTRKHVESWKKAPKGQKWVLSHSSFQQMDENGNIYDGIFRFQQVEPEEILGYELVRNHVYLSGTMVKKQAFVEVGGFDKNLTHCEDWDLWIRLAANGGFLYLDDPLAYIRRHNNNASRTLGSVADGERKVLKKYSAEYLEKAIIRRRLPQERNIVDYVSVMYRIDQWELGYEKVIQLLKKSPDTTLAFLFKGMYEVRLKRYEQALETFKQALALDVNRCEFLNNIGACHIALGHADIARGYLTKAVQLLPNYMDAQYNLMIVEEREEVTPRFTWRELRPVLLKYG